MTGLPALQVLLDNGTGTFPYDISRYARLTDQASWTRGRPDELQQIQPGSFGLTLDNTDGAFSFGRTNLLSNPDFDSAAGFSSGWSPTGGGITLSAQTGQKINGAESLQAVGTTTGASTYVFQTVACLASTQYTLSAWRFVPSAPTGAATGNASLWVQDSTGVLSTTSTLTTTVATGVWVRETVTITTAIGATTITARLYIPNGTVYWDAVELVQGTGPTYQVFPDQRIRLRFNTNMLTNPSFETVLASGWSTAGAGITLSDQTGTVLDGAHALQAVGTTSGADTYVHQTVACLPSTTYTFQASRFVPSALTGAAIGNRSLWMQDNTGVSASTTTLVVGTGTGAWVTESVTITTSSTAATIDVRCYVPNGTIYWDNTALYTGASLLRNRWTGLVQSWPVNWPTGGQEFSTVIVSATDALATMARCLLRSPAYEEILLDAPAAYWPCDESGSGVTQARDASGNNGPPLAGATPPNSVTFGASVGLPDGSTGISSLTSNGLLAAVPISGSTLYLETVFETTSASGLQTLMSVSDGLGSTWLIQLNAGALTMESGVAVAGVVNDGKPHVCALAFKAGPVFDAWLDGVKIVSNHADTNSLSGGTLAVVVGGTTGVVPVVQAHASLSGTVPTDARVARRHQAILTDMAGETPAARLTRLAAYSGVSVGALDTASSTVCGASAQTGQSAADVANEVADATLGIVYVDKDGALSSVSGYSIAAAVTPALTIDASYAATDTAVAVDMLQVVNRLTGQASSSSNLTFAQNAASILAHGVYDPGAKTWNVSTDAQATDLTNWTVGNYANPDARFPTLVLDLLTLDLATVATALQLDLGSFLRVTGMPSQTPGGTTIDLIVQSVTESYSTTSWTLAVTCAKRIRYGGWVLGDATYGVLDSTTKLYV